MHSGIQPGTAICRRLLIRFFRKIGLVTRCNSSDVSSASRRAQITNSRFYSIAIKGRGRSFEISASKFLKFSRLPPRLLRLILIWNTRNNRLQDLMMSTTMLTHEPKRTKRAVCAGNKGTPSSSGNVALSSFSPLSAYLILSIWMIHFVIRNQYWIMLYFTP